MAARFPAEPFSPDRLPDPNDPPPGVDPIYGTILRAAVAGADAYRTTRAAARRDGGILRLGNRFVPADRYREIAFVALGDAAVSQALAVTSSFGERLTQGLVAGPDPVPPEVPFPARQVRRAGPDAGDTPVLAEVLELVRGLGEKDLLLVLLSPGSLPLLTDAPVGFTVPEWRRWLADLTGKGATGREIGVLARVLGRGAVGGRLAASTPADVVTLVVDAGVGGELVGGGPTRPVGPAERAEATAAIDRLGVGGSLAPSARAGLTDAAAPLASRSDVSGTARVVVVASPGDALRDVGEAVAEKRWRPVLAELSIDLAPSAAAEKLAGRVQEIVAAAPPGAMTSSGGRPPRGVIAFAGTTLAVPEGADDGDAARAFLARLAAELPWREATVGLLRTGGVRPGDAPGSGVVRVGAATGSDRRPAATPVPIRPGITDVGFIAAVVVPPT